jgi:hypothetical protein
VHRQSDTCHKKQATAGDDSLWQKTQYANLVRYKPSKTYFARIRIGGKLIRFTLKTKVLSAVKLRLGDLEKKEHPLAEHQAAVADGSMDVADALVTYRQRLERAVSP